MTIGWAKQPLTRFVARGMRGATKNRELDGHHFDFNDLKELWISDDEHHVVCVHDMDHTWQHWTDRHPDGWVLSSLHHSRAAACSAALDHEDLADTELPSPGTYVTALANLSGTAREIRVRCLTSLGAELCGSIFRAMDYIVRVEEVGEPVQIAG